jgi:predicted RNA-binding protein (virulence factor B family)
MVAIGKFNTLSVLRETASGYYLDGGEHGEILLPGNRGPENLPWGSEIRVFLYLDSEDRLIATTETPRATVGEFCGLEVLTVHPQIGAFLDWGLGKDLLLPFREQGSQRVEAGERVVVYIKFDERSQRIVATMKWNRFLKPAPADLKSGEELPFLIAGRTPLGFQAIVDGRYSGLLYHANLGIELAIGESMRGYLRAVRPDGKIDLSLDPPGPLRVTDLASQILEALEVNGGHIEFDDRSSPDAIRARFRTSKKAFKKALGTLYKERKISFPEQGGTRLNKD